MVRCEVVFRGQVQGVGFRATARDFAREAGLTGWVRNMPDGSVEVAAEGPLLLVEDLISRLKNYFSVREATVVQTPARAKDTDFRIRY